MLVTRTEEWCVEAKSAEEARQLLAAGAGYRCHLGDCLHVEVERVDFRRRQRGQVTTGSFGRRPITEKYRQYP